ncbi:MAG: acyl-CoA dehydrogenase [Proteobacteria bacterium]|nr:acyl-CoA dehydrogenase [Pseudomonadota bacterium]
MNFDLTDEERGLAAKVKDAFDDEQRARLVELDAGRIEPTRELLSPLLATLAKTGYLALDRGEGAIRRRLIVAREALATRSPSLFLTIETGRLFGELIQEHGSAELASKVLPELAAGRALGTIALTEPEHGLPLDALSTTAAREGDGFDVSGVKARVPIAPLADWLAVAVDLEGRLAWAVIRTDEAGVGLGPRVPFLGPGGLAAADVTLEGVRVEPGFLLGPFDDPGAITLPAEREDDVMIAAALGVMQRAFEAAKRHAKERQGGGKPLIAQQEIGFKLAEMLTLVQTARLLAYRAAWLADAGDREAGVVAACAKVFCTENAEKVASQALQVLGGGGLVQGNPAEQAYREAKYLQLAGTAVEWARMKIGDLVLAAGR